MSTPRNEGPDPLTAAFTALAVVEAVLGVVRERLADAQEAERDRHRVARGARGGKRERDGLHAV